MMYNDEVVALNLFVGEAENVKSWSFSIDPAKGADKCASGQEPAADSIRCEKLPVTCRAPKDIVKFKAIKAGKYEVWADYCENIIAAKINSWSAGQAFVTPNPPDAAFYTSINNKWVKYETYTLKRDGSKGVKLTLQFRPHARWVSNENKCYVGEHEPFIMPNCRLYRQSVLTAGVRTLDTRYEFAEGAQADILSTLSRKGLLGGDESVPEDQKRDAQAPGGKAPLDVVGQAKKGNPRPEFKEPEVEKTGVVFDGLPGKGTLMARKKTPRALNDEPPACAAEVDWSEEVKKGRVYALNEFTEFYVAFKPEEVAPVVEAAMPTWGSLAGEAFEVGQDAEVIMDSSVDFYMTADIKGTTKPTTFEVKATIAEAGFRLAAPVGAAALAIAAYFH